jgi:hypothetical protein
MILRHHRYDLEYWRIRDLPSDRVVIKEDLVSLEEQQGTTRPKAMIWSHDLNHKCIARAAKMHYGIMSVG